MLLLFSPSAVVRRWGGLVRAVLRARRAALSASSRGPFGFGPRLLRLRLAGPAASAPCSRLLRLRPRSSGKVTMFLPLAVRSVHHLSAPRMICPHKVSLRQVYAQFVGQELHHGGRQQLRAGLQPHALQVPPVRPAPAMQRAQANTRTGCQLRFQHCFHTHIVFFHSSVRLHCSRAHHPIRWTDRTEDFYVYRAQECIIFPFRAVHACA